MTARCSASIVIPAWNEWELTRACLESLRPTMGLRDEVIVVDNGSRDGTAAGLTRFGWVRVVTHEENQGFAAGCNAGAAVAGGDAIVFLNNDTLVHGRWLDALLDPFADPAVGATGPRSNFVSGPQVVEEVGYRPDHMGDLRRFARQWQQEHRGEVTETARLVGFCLAVRRSAFVAIDGFDEGFGIGGYEDDDLCTRLRDAGWRLLIAHESFVHHHGHRTFEANGVDWFAIQSENERLYGAKHGAAREPEQLAGRPLVSACLIVKDEEENLPSCLASIRGLADEVIVYDTGSQDRTIDIAREAGATVFEGYWDDDFGRARNAAVEHCTGEWVLHIDADEVATGDVAAVRGQLRTSGTADFLRVAIDSLGRAGVEVAFTHQPVRLFRRLRGHWDGRLHEQVVPRPGEHGLTLSTTSHVRLVHSGYSATAMDAKDKYERNIRVAEEELAQGHGHRGVLLTNLARALAAAERLDDAIDRFVEARALATDPVLRRLVLRQGAETLLDAGRPSEALDWARELRRASKSDAMADYLEGIALANLGDPAGALACLDRVSEVKDDDGWALAPHLVHLRRGLMSVAAGRWDQACDELLAVASRPGLREPIWGPLVDAHRNAGRSLADVAAVVADEQLMFVLGQVAATEPEGCDELADALWARFPADIRLLALSVRLAPMLELPRALAWSIRLREADQAHRCPLVAIAADAGAEPVRRLQAAALLAAANDERAEDLVTSIGPVVPEPALGPGLLALDELAPTLLPTFIAAAATGPRRSLALARLLAEWGAVGEALALVGHGFGEHGTDGLAAEAAAFVTSVGAEPADYVAAH